MKSQLPFDSIESSHAFITLLSQVVLETKRELEGDVQREQNSSLPRRLRALEIVECKLEILESHLEQSRRILNDLRSLRRLLFAERTEGGAARRMPGTVAKSETSTLSASLDAGGSALGPESMVRGTSVKTRKRAFSSRHDDAHDAAMASTAPWYVRRERTA